MAKWTIKTAADYARAHKAIQAKLDKVTEDLKAVPAKALTDIAVDCLSRAVERAPVELGDLRGSGYADINGAAFASGDKSGSVKTLGFTPPPAEVTTAEIGFFAPYALVQHEHVEFNHPLGGQAKYLESVVVERSAAWRDYLIKAAKDAVGGDA